MALIQEVFDMQRKGMNELEIVRTLQEQGYSSQEINDAINQVKIKAAVGEQGEHFGGPPIGREMRPSIMQQQAEEEVPVPTPSKAAYPTYPTTAPSGTEYGYEEQSPYAAAEYPSYPQYPSGGIDAETVEEITEEIVEEKFADFRRKTGDIVEMKSDFDNRIKSTEERLKRIEASIDKIQVAILGKVQEYGKDVKSLGTEMRALEGAFSKILNPLVENINELNEITNRLKERKTERIIVKEKPAGEIVRIERAEKPVRKIIRKTIKKVVRKAKKPKKQKTEKKKKSITHTHIKK